MSAVASVPAILECKDTSEKIDLCESQGLYIKPIARLNITIQLPPTKTAGQTVSTIEIIEKLKKHSLPEEYISLRVIKSTLEFIRFEAEIENKSSLKALLSRLDNSTIKMLTYTDVLKIRAAEAKIIYSLKHDWDSFYNCVNVNVNDLKPGERPDTIHIQDLPCKWFSADKKSFVDTNKKPNEAIVREVFSVFGEIRAIDIPMLTMPNSRMFNKSDTFDVYVQYKEYFSFVKAMDTFRGMKLLYIESDTKQAFTANVRFDFDRTKHLSEREIQKRSIDKLKAIELEKIKNAQIEKEKEKAAKKQEIANFKQMLEEAAKKDEANQSSGEKGDDENKTKEQRRKEREEARRQKRLAKKQAEEEKKLSLKIALEERKILIAQRKLESMRLLEELFNRVKNNMMKEEMERLKNEKPEEKNDQEKVSEENEEKKENENEIEEKKETLNVEDNNKIETNTDTVTSEPPVAFIETGSETTSTATAAVNIVNNVQVEDEEGELVEESEIERVIERKVEKISKEDIFESNSDNNNNNNNNGIVGKNEKKRKYSSLDKQEHDLREKLIRSVAPLTQQVNYKNEDLNDREDLRKRLSSNRKLKSSVIVKSNDSDSNDSKSSFSKERKSASIESN